MCRFIVFWGEKPIKLSYWISEAENSLLKQSERDISQRPNPDGWGFAYQNNGKTQVIKNTDPAYLDSSFRPAADRLYGEMLFAHIRRRSQGPVLMENTHPFVHENWMFMHNGNIPNIEKYKNAMSTRLPSHEAIKTHGTTDSEFLFRYFLHWFRSSKRCDVYCVLNIVSNIIRQLVELTDPEDQKQLALNFMLTNGEFLLGFRRNRTLYYTQVDTGMVISSEPVDKTFHWNEIPENHFVISNAPGDIQLMAYEIEFSRREANLVE